MISLNSPLTQSIAIHFTLLVIFFFFSLFNKNKIPTIMKVPVEIKEVILPKEIPASKPIDIKTQIQPETQKKLTVQPKKIFGISKKTLTTDSNENSVSIKSGNTIAKEIDQEHLNPEDEQALPVPTEEYLISKMPRLKNEIRIPYPSEARMNNIEGLVLLEILIDEKGKVREAKLINGPGFGLNEAALEAIYNFEFIPALVDEKPVAVKIQYGYRFILN